MSQLEYYGRDPKDTLPHTSALKAWGVVLIVFGSLSILMGLLVVLVAAVLLVKPMPGSATSGQNPSAVLAGAIVYLVGGTFLILMGVGSLRGRRWVRPLMIIGTVLTACSGLIAVVSLGVGLVHYFQHPPAKPIVTPGTPALPFDPVMIGIVGGGCFVVALMVVLPLVLLWFYGRSSVRTTLDALDPKSRWTDRVPLPVLGWSVACMLGGVSLLFSATQGIFPCFSGLLFDSTAVLVIAALSSMLIVGAILCYCRNGFGPLITVAAIAVLAASYGTFEFLGDQQAYIDYILRNMPAAQKQMAERFTANALLGPALMYSAALVYVMLIRKRFGERRGGTNDER